MTPHGQTKPLSLDQQTLYAFLKAYLATHGRAPTTREIADACDFTRGKVRYGLHKLEAKGYITRRESRIETTCLTDKPFVPPAL